MKREKRKYTRAQVGYPVLLKSSQGLMIGQIKDISAGGAFICCQEPLQSDEVLRITVRFSPLSPPLKAKAAVLRSTTFCLDDETLCYGMSVQFIKISNTARKIISSLTPEYATAD